MSIQLSSDITTARQQLAQLPEKIEEAAWEEIVQIVTLMKALAQVSVRVDTGSLRDSIRVERGGMGKGWRVISIRAGGYITNPKTGKLVDYACIVEKKYPYICPAWRAVCPALMDLIKRRVLEQVT